VGEAKTTLKGFFGQPLAGIASTGLGSAAGMASSGGVGAGASGSSPFGSSSLGSSPGSGLSSGSGTKLPGRVFARLQWFVYGQLIVRGDRDGQWFDCRFWLRFRFWLGDQQSVSDQLYRYRRADHGNRQLQDGQLNHRAERADHLPDWEFIYDPRIEQLRRRRACWAVERARRTRRGWEGIPRDLVVAPAQALEAAQALYVDYAVEWDQHPYAADDSAIGFLSGNALQNRSYIFITTFVATKLKMRSSEWWFLSS